MHDQKYSARVNEALALAISRILKPAKKKRIGFEAVKDIAQLTIIELADELRQHGWQERVLDVASWKLTDYVRELQKEDTMKDTIMIINENKRAPTEERRGEFVDMVTACLLPREWQAVHGLYWVRDTQESIAKRMGVEQCTVSRLHTSALARLKEAMHAQEIYRDNWRSWWYER